MDGTTRVIRYRTGYQLVWLFAALGIYAAVIALVFGALIHFSFISDAEGSFVYRAGFLILVLFAYSLRFREDFDFLLTLGNTRDRIFLALSISALLLSFLVAGIMVAERVFVDFLNNAFGFTRIIDPFHFLSPYRSRSLPAQFAFFFSASTCASAFGLLLGSLFYRFGKFFMVAFWVAVSVLPTLGLSILAWVLAKQGELGRFLYGTGKFLSSFDLLSASTLLFIFAIAFSIFAGLNIRGLSQK